MKVALVHDQLSEFGGSERVLVALKKIYPKAPIFTTAYNKDSLGVHKNLIKNWKVYVSWFGKIPFLNRFYSPFRFLTPLIWESFDFSKYDLVISSSGSWMSKGIKTKRPTLHISYVHHPPRYLYGYETALEWQKYWIVRLYAYIVNHFLRLWDFESSQRADFLIANSEETKKRIEKFYRREATVIYPPVNISDKIPSQKFETGNYYLTVSRLAKAKHIDILIKAANDAKFNLKIIGSGRDLIRLKALAGPTVEFLEKVSDQQFQDLFVRAKAFLFASRDEEFGIAPVEAMGYGLPVIAFRSGGIPEFVKNADNGFLYDQLDSSSLINKMRQFENLSDMELLEMKKSARKSAERFTEKIFEKNIKNFVNSKLKYARTTRS